MKKEFYAWLETVADIEYPSPKKDTARKTDDESIEVLFNDKLVVLNNKSNPTLKPIIKKIKPITKICDLGCGDVIQDQIIEKRVCFTPITHWRTRCKTCGKYVSPDQSELIEGGHKIALLYITHFNSLQDK